MSRVIDYFHQYGFKVAMRRIFFSFVRRFYYAQTELMFQMTIPKWDRYNEGDYNIVDITSVFLEQHSAAFEEHDRDLFLKFIENGDQGLAYLIEDEVAGYAWIQTKGNYHFGKYFTYQISPETVVFKNLFVFPNYRGRGIAGKLDYESLNRSQGKVGVLVIIAENRYAIRNWEKLGMKRILQIRIRFEKFLRRKPTIEFVSLAPEGNTAQQSITTFEKQ